MSKVRGLSLLLLCFCFLHSVWGCQTPNGESGECTPIKSCTSLFNLLQKSNINNQEIEFLKKSQCGYENNEPKVCCPTTQDTTTNSNLLPNTDVCGKDAHDRIVGGELTSIEEFPWMALLEYDKDDGRGFHCGGSLINENYVVTAAHCVTKLPSGWKLISVRLGEHDLKKPVDCEDETPGFQDCSDEPLNIPVTETIFHENYGRNDPYQHDIALVRLSKKVSFTKYVTPICLLSSNNVINNRYEGLEMVVAGWGITENYTTSDIKLKLKVPIFSKPECVSKYKKQGVNIKDTQLCAGGEKGKDSCRGDSGGPLMYYKDNWFLTGIVSFGSISCGAPGFPGIYTKAEDYNSWIIRHLKP